MKSPLLQIKVHGPSRDQRSPENERTPVITFDPGGPSSTTAYAQARMFQHEAASSSVIASSFPRWGHVTFNCLCLTRYDVKHG
jgi:hypothetical protein